MFVIAGVEMLLFLFIMSLFCGCFAMNCLYLGYYWYLCSIYL